MARARTHEADPRRRHAFAALRAGGGALGCVLAFALLVQLVFAGIVAERMAFAAPTGDVICAHTAAEAPQGADPQGTDRHGTPDHPAKCVVCALATLATPLPGPAGVLPPSPAVHTDTAGFAAATPGIPQGRHSPRSSQGPPRSA